jgi:hypothetical protein
VKSSFLPYLPNSDSTLQIQIPNIFPFNIRFNFHPFCENAGKMRSYRYEEETDFV